MDRYEFNAPKFVDFKAPDEENRDDFFGPVVKEAASPERVGNTVVCKTKEGHEMDCHTGDTPPQVTVPSESATNDTAAEDDLIRTMQVLHVTDGSPTATASTNQEALPRSSSRKSHIMLTRLDVVTGRLVDVAQILDYTERDVAQSSEESTYPAYSAATMPQLNIHPKRARESACNQKSDHPHKYISMAEAVLKFQQKTPRRFHSRLPGKSTPITVKPRNPTIPHAPHLMACTRVRQVDYPTREKREAMEVAEINRYKISALPVNPHIFQSPKLGRRVPKFTMPEPFKLTEVKKKEPEVVPQYKFTAQPVPKNVLLAPQPSLLSSPRHIVKARHKMDRPKVFAASVQVDNGEEVIVQKEVFNFGVPVQERKNTPLKRSTEIQPFSFEERNKEMARRKEERIKMFLEEERQARIFHAQPLPNLHRRRLGSIPDLLVMSADSTLQDCAKENVSTVFKARPAAVLKKEPFVPRKPDRSPLKPKNFSLKTESRSNERKEYEERVRAELEEFEKLKREHEEQQRLEEEAESAANRKLAESFRAQPMPKFKTPKKKPVDIKLTSPESPFTHRSAK